MTESVASGSQSAEVQGGSFTSSSAPMVSYFGRMDAFDPKIEEWSTYVERLEMFFVVNNVPDGKKAASLLTLIGGRMYALLKSLTTPTKPTELSFKEIVEIMGRHLTPKPIVIAERYKFHKYHQEEGQSIREFLAKLQKLAETCEFGGYRDEALRDRLVCGITSQTIGRKLLGEADLTLKKAVDIAVRMELTDKEITQISAIQQVHKVQLQECFRCGKHNHSPDKCFHKLSECHICKRKGHISPKCPQKISSNPPASSKPKQAEAKQNKSFKKKKKSSRIKFVDTQASSSESEVPEDEDFSLRDEFPSEWPMFAISSPSRRKADEILVPVKINGISFKMELDTGASVTVIPEEMWEKELGSVPLVESSVTLKSYSGHAIPVVGETTVHVQYQTQQVNLPIVVTKGKGLALMGRDWLSKLKLDWHQISNIQQANPPKPKLEDIVQQFPKLFDGKLGTIKGFTAELKVKQNAPPQYFKPRTVPFALRDKVEAEIQRLEKEGVLKKVESSDWATPIVPVLKPDGTVRICGDFKVTLNQYLDVPEYPMPTSEELFTKLNGGELFTKLDLSHAYQQVVLDEKSQPYVTITTHLGLYRYTRLPFGVAAAPAIFQQIIDKMLDGLSQTGGILDDLIVTGENDEQHARNLYKTLKKFEESGAKFKKSKCVIMQPKIEYFAFVLDRHGIHPSPAKVQAILEVRDPQNRSELQSFLGLVNYYRKFIPNMSTLVSPLNQLLSKDTPWCWSPECKGSFQALKDTLASSSVLAHYSPKLEVQLAVDASPVGLGAVISHITEDGTERPIAYASRSLTKAEKNYSVIEKEALAIIFGIRKFQQYLYGRKFTLLTDHQPLTLLFGPKRGIPPIAASRLQRWAIQLSA